MGAAMSVPELKDDLRQTSGGSDVTEIGGEHRKVRMLRQVGQGCGQNDLDRPYPADDPDELQSPGNKNNRLVDSLRQNFPSKDQLKSTTISDFPGLLDASSLFHSPHKERSFVEMNAIRLLVRLEISEDRLLYPLPFHRLDFINQ